MIREQTDYHGWTKEGKLYCRRCWASLAGTPREQMRRNWCEGCNAELYPDDDAWLDMRGFELFRELVKLYMGLAVRKIRNSSRGANTCSQRTYAGRLPQGSCLLGSGWL